MPVVQVFDYILYPSEIAEYLPSNITAEDSMVLSQNYITHWITQKLLLQKAIENLPEQQDNIQKRVENYWTSQGLFHLVLHFVQFIAPTHGLLSSTFRVALLPTN